MTMPRLWEPLSHYFAKAYVKRAPAENARSRLANQSKNQYNPRFRATGTSWAKRQRRRVVQDVFSIPIEAPEPSRASSKRTRPPLGVRLREYIGGQENILVRAVMDYPPKELARYHPLVLFGPSSTGKTLLVAGIASRWMRRRPTGRTLVVTGTEFARDYRNATQTDSLGDFRQKYRSCSLLVIDDLDGLGGRSSAQIELIHTLDSLTERRRWLIATLKQSPADAHGLLPRLASRLASGLTIPLQPPGLAARRLLLRRLAQLRGIELPGPVCDLVAEFLPQQAAHLPTVPHLDAAVSRLATFAKKEKKRCIDEDLARRWLVTQHDSPNVELAQVVREVSKYFKLKAADLRGPTRLRCVVRARGVAMWLARALTDNSLAQVGRYFGNRDHTTVLHACRKTDALIQTDPAIRRAVDELTLQLCAT